MNRDQKAAVVERIAAEIGDAGAVFAVDYRGISVPQAAELRARLRDADATFRIVKNSLTERAADHAGAEALRGLLEGPTALTFVRGDAALAAKALSDFSRANSVLAFKGGLLEGEELSVEQVVSIARLPARDVLFGQFVGTVASPLTGLVRGLNGLIAGLAVQLHEIAERGLVGGGAAPVPEAPTSEAEGEAAADASQAGEPQADAPAAAEEAGEQADAPAAAEEPDEQADASAAAEDPDAAEAKEEEA